MGQYSNKLLGLLFLLVLISLFVIVPRKNLTSKPSTKVSSIDSSVEYNVNYKDTIEFLERFSGKWKSEEISQIIEFKQINEVLVVDIRNENKPNEDRMIELRVFEYISSDNRWILEPLKKSDFRFNLKQFSQNEIVFFSSTTREKTEGVSKPLNYFRIE